MSNLTEILEAKKRQYELEINDFDKHKNTVNEWCIEADEYQRNDDCQEFVEVLDEVIKFGEVVCPECRDDDDEPLPGSWETNE